MEHVVFWAGADGRPAFERTPSLDEAVQVVSRLRNDEGIDGARVYTLTEVPLTVRVEYKIEVPAETAAPAAAPAAPTAPVVPLTPPIEDVVPAEPTSHLSVVRDDSPFADHPVEQPVAPAAADEHPGEEHPAEGHLPDEAVAADVPAARSGDVLPDSHADGEPAQHHRGRGIGFFSSNR
ncbi:MAG TPA: hypothetical protein VHE83_08915 [Mycobacteriales bacterium]|nr:hypothetical protein [Mycobacteriales bacterium]